MVRTLLALYFWAMAIAWTFVCFLGTCVTHFGERFVHGWRAGRGVHAIASIWGRFIIRMCPGWSVEVVGAEHLPPAAEATVIVANHESMSDICAIYYLGVQFRWLAKAEVFNLPCVGPAMRWAGYVPVRRGSRESGGAAMRTSSARIQQGLSMFFFPEGTRSEGGVIKEFKLGAFKLAQESQARVLPVALHGAGDLLPKHSWKPGRARVKVTVLPPHAAPAPDADLTAYAAEVRRQIVQVHDSLV